MAGNIQHSITLDDICLGYEPGKYLLESVSAGIRKGEMIAVAGRNGTGKSTLLRTIARIQEPAGGQVRIDGRPLKEIDSRELARSIAFAGTGTQVTENMTVFEMVSLGRHPYTNWWGQLRRVDMEKVRESIEFTGMKDFSDARVNRLSDGERQRVMIAMALAQDTGVIILDEPTAHLDIPNRIEVVEVLHRLRKNGRTVIYSTHDFDTIFAYADQLWIIREGRLVMGAPEELGMRGVFEELFSDDGVGFERKNLRFAREKDRHGRVSLEGNDEVTEFWTGRALVRAGLEIVQGNTEARVTVSKHRKGCTWKYEKGGTVVVYKSLYDLVGHLTRSE